MPELRVSCATYARCPVLLVRLQVVEQSVSVFYGLRCGITELSLRWRIGRRFAGGNLSEGRTDPLGYIRFSTKVSFELSSVCLGVIRIGDPFNLSLEAQRFRGEGGESLLRFCRRGVTRQGHGT